MPNLEHSEELEIRRLSQELAVAWRRGRAGFVLDSLAAEGPLRAALVATLVHETLARWDRYDSRWPTGFRRALLIRSRGSVTPEELAELEREYSRTFGCSPPLPGAGARPADRPLTAKTANLQAKRIRAALASGEPLPRERPAPDAPMFLRLQPARR